MNYESKISGEDLDGATIDDREDQARNKKRVVIVAAVAAAIILAYVAYQILSGGGDTAAAGAEDSQAPAVTVVVPGRQDVVRTINATGTLAARVKFLLALLVMAAV